MHPRNSPSYTPLKQPLGHPRRRPIARRHRLPTRPSRPLRGKSIGFLRTKVHTPTDKEIKNNALEKVGIVIDEWILLEYAYVFLPARQYAVVEAVSKRLNIPEDFLKQIPDSVRAKALTPNAEADNPLEAATIPFTTLAQIEKALARALD